MTDDNIQENVEAQADEIIENMPDIPVRDANDFNTGRADTQSVGTKIRAKVKRGTGTRDQDEIVIEGRGINAQEAADDFEQALDRLKRGEWADRLRELQSGGGDGQ